MLGKIEIVGTIEVVTGLHIGATDAFTAIGAIDTPVIKDKISNLPYIPGTSLKGKMRSLLGRRYNNKLVTSRNEDDERLLRLFGASKEHSNNGTFYRSRLIFTDAMLENIDELKRFTKTGTEVKEENSINPLTGESNPRQLERVVRGAKFQLEMIYNVDDDVNEENIIEDFKTIAEGLKLLEYDYLGGSGSRGYGRVKFTDLDVNCVIGNVEDSIVENCKKVLEDR